MDVDVRTHGGSRYSIHLSLDESEVKGAFDRTFQQLSDRGGIKGFRPGRVPRKILERYYEDELIRALTYESLVNDRLEKVMTEQDLRPIDQVDIKHGAIPDEDEELAETIKSGLAPEDEGSEADEEASEEDEDAMEDVPLVEGEPFEFYATFTAYPRPQLPDLSDLKLKRPVAEVSDEEVNERLQQLQRVNAEEVEVEDREEIADGDVVIADLKIVLEDEDASEMEPSQQEITIGEGTYLAEVDQKLIGHKPGDVFEIEFAYEEDHPDETLAGKSAKMMVEVDSFTERRLPELDDEFAQSIGEYETLEDLRNSIREQIQGDRDREAGEELRAQVVRYILDGTEVELPAEFVDRATQRNLDELGAELLRAGMSLEEFAESNDIDEAELRDRQREQAETSLKFRLAFEALAEQRDAELTEEDIAEEVRMLVEETGGDAAFVQQALMVQASFAEEVQERATRRKLLDQLVAAAEVTDVPADEYRAQQEAEAAAFGDAEKIEQGDEVPASNEVEELSSDEAVGESEEQ